MQDEFIMNEIYIMSVNPVIKEAEERQARILDADYSKVDIHEYCRELQYLTIKEQQMLANVLNSFPVLSLEAVVGDGLVGDLRETSYHGVFREGSGFVAAQMVGGGESWIQHLGVDRWVDPNACSSPANRLDKTRSV